MGGCGAGVDWRILDAWRACWWACERPLAEVDELWWG